MPEKGTSLHVHVSLFCSSEPPRRQDPVKEFLELAGIREQERTYEEAGCGKKNDEQRLEKAEYAEKDSGDKKAKSKYNTCLGVAELLE